AEAVREPGELVQRTAKVLLPCFNVSRVDKVEGAWRVSERKFCQFSPFQVAGPVDQHYSIGIFQKCLVGLYPFRAKTGVVANVADHHVHPRVLMREFKGGGEAAPA